MKTRFRPSTLAVCLLAVVLPHAPLVQAWQEGTPPTEVKPSTAPRVPASSVDPRFRTPRATARTLLVAMNRSEDDPHHIEEAIACLDLSGIPPERRDGGRFAAGLEFILRSTNIPTMVIPEDVEGSECEIGEGKDIKLILHRMPDGRWLFDSKTLRDLTRMRLALWQRAVAAGPGKEAAEVASDFRSPYALIRTFTNAFQRKDLDAAARCLDLSEIPAPARPILGRVLAFKLKEILDRSVFVILQDLPDTSASVPLEALVRPEGRIAGERQAEGRRKGQWLFNRDTIRSVEELYDVFESKPLHPERIATGGKAVAPVFRRTPGVWLRHRLPDGLRYRIALTDRTSIALYQIVGLALLLALVIPLYRLVVRPMAFVVRALMRRREIATDDREVAVRVRPLGWLAVLAMLVSGVAILDLRIDTAGPLLALLVPAFWLVLTLVSFQLIDPLLKLVAGAHATQEGATTVVAMAYPVMSLVLKILVVSLGLVRVLGLLDFDVATVLAGLGIGGLAFALAAQDTLKNFLGSLMLIADRTFRVGDLVKIGANEGVVESVGLRTTRMRGLDDSLLTIPNSDLTTAHVTNFGARRYRRFQTRIIVPYGTAPDLLIQFRDALLELLQKHPGVRREMYEVALNDLDKSGVEILVQAFLDVANHHEELQARDSLILELLRQADQLGIAPLASLEKAAK